MIKEQLRLYFIYGSNNGDITHSLDIIEQALGSGVTMFQLREKGPDALQGEALFKFALSVKELTKRYSVPMIINDDVDLAIKVQADGIHLGQDDMKPEDLPVYFNGKIVGLSIGNHDELEASNLDNVDYIGTGPVFPTLSKDDAGESIGTGGLKEMRDSVANLPMVAIGGITAANYNDCMSSGADGVAVISAISGARDVEQAVKSFLK